MRGFRFNKDDSQIAKQYLEGNSLETIAQSYGVVRNTIKKALQHQGVPIRSKNDPIYRDARSYGENHHSWKGGRIRVFGGYIRVWVDSKHPFYQMSICSGGSHYIPEHRLVMAEHLGRPLEPYETVHHKNGVPDDNRIENLELRLGAHGPGQKWKCADCGSSHIIAVSLG